MFMQRWTSNKDRKVTLTDIKLNEDKTLALTYRVETPETITQLCLPSVLLPLVNDFTIYGECFCPDYAPVYYTDVGFGKTLLNANSEGDIYTAKIIETKTKEMTLEEIEKKLGHKIKLVTKKGTTK
jgi:hypothetical protein